MSVNDQHRNALPAGYRLENFRLESVLGHGGFGITYRAVDEDLQQAVAIKEYLPREVALRDRDSTVVPVSESDRETFEWGLERFLDEARTLARFRHPNIVGVRRFLRANGTAYLVMDFCEGESLENVLVRQNTLSPAQIELLLDPLLGALESLHASGVTHRDIKPGNIYLRDDGSPVLLDFGAARQALAQHSRSVTAMATPGYAAFEQYSTKGKQGPWTDIYGLGATLYRCVTGQRPPDASDRMLGDELVPTTEVASDCYPRPLLQQIDAALKLRPQDRPQSITAWRRLGVEGVALLPKGAEVIAAPVLESQAPVPRPAREPAAATGSGRGWLWLLIVGAVIGLFIWTNSEKMSPQRSETATSDSPAPGPAQPTPSDPIPPSVDQIIAWSSSDIRDLGPKVKEVVPIALRGGEHAYIAAVDFDMTRTGRLYWRGYLMVRPSLNEARVLNGFGGQYNEIQSVDKRSRRQSSVIIGSAASGQGIFMSSYSVVTFDDWKAESLYTVEESSNSGWCGEDTGRDCSGNDVSIEIKNVSGFGHNQRIELVVHNERYSSPDPETTPYTYSNESEIVVIER